jgi:hypothetical protein
MLFEVILLALLLGFVTGGSFKKLMELKVKWLSFLILSAVLSVLPKIPWFCTTFLKFGVPVVITIALLRYGFLIAFVLLNIKRYPFTGVILLGGLSNALVTLANGGRMPVAPEVIGTNSSDIAIEMLKNAAILNYKLADSTTLLWPLGDIIRIQIYYYYFLSIGDILVAIGIFVLILQLMEPKLIKKVAMKIH